MCCFLVSTRHIILSCIYIALTKGEPEAISSSTTSKYITTVIWCWWQNVAKSFVKRNANQLGNFIEFLFLSRPYTFVFPKTSSLSRGSAAPYTKWGWLFSGSFVLSLWKKRFGVRKAKYDQSQIIIGKILFNGICSLQFPFKNQASQILYPWYKYEWGKTIFPLFHVSFQSFK